MRYFVVNDNGDGTYKVLGKASEVGMSFDPNHKWIMGDSDLDAEDAKAELVDGSIVISEDSTKKLRREQKEKGRTKVQLGRDVLDFINGYNEDLDMSEAETQAVMGLFSSVVALLQTGALSTSKSLIQAADLTGTVYTEDDRTEVLAVLQDAIDNYNGMYPSS